MAQNAFDLGVTRLAHDDHAVALAYQALGSHMNLLHVGAGGVDHGKAALASGVNDLRHHAVGADNHSARRSVVQGVGQTNACLGELAHHDGIMDERAQGVDLIVLPRLRRGSQRHVECTLHAVAGTGVGSDFDGGGVCLAGHSLGSVNNFLAHG